MKGSYCQSHRPWPRSTHTALARRQIRLPLSQLPRQHGQEEQRSTALGPVTRPEPRLRSMARLTHTESDYSLSSLVPFLNSFSLSLLTRSAVQSAPYTPPYPVMVCTYSVVFRILSFLRMLSTFTLFGYRFRSPQRGLGGKGNLAIP